MADGSDDGGGEGAFFKRSSRGCASYSPAAPDGGVRGDGTGLCRRAAGEEFQDRLPHAHGEVAVLFRAARLYGSGEAKVRYISAMDVAEFAVAAAKKMESGHIVLEMGGPEALSQLEAVRIFEERLNKEFDLNFVPVEALREQYRSSDPVQKVEIKFLVESFFKDPHSFKLR